MQAVLLGSYRSTEEPGIPKATPRKTILEESQGLLPSALQRHRNKQPDIGRTSSQILTEKQDVVHRVEERV